MRGPCAAYNLSRKLHAFLCRFYRCSCCWSLSRRRGNCCIWFVILLVSRHPLVALLLIVMIWRRCMRLQAGYYRSVVFLNDNLWCSTITEATLANILREFLVYWIICFCFFSLLVCRTWISGLWGNLGWSYSLWSNKFPKRYPTIHLFFHVLFGRGKVIQLSWFLS